MIGQLLKGSFFQDYGILIILIVFLVFMLIFSASRRKKDAKMAEDFANNLKIGDKVKTYSGIYGKIISIKDTPSGKICLLETGEGKNISYMAVDVFAIYNIETPVVEKKDADNVDAQEKSAVELVPNDQDVKSETIEEKKDVAKKSQKKTSAEKKTTTKATSNKTKTAEKKGQSKSSKKAEPKSELDKIKENENK